MARRWLHICLASSTPPLPSSGERQRRACRVAPGLVVFFVAGTAAYCPGAPAAGSSAAADADTPLPIFRHSLQLDLSRALMRRVDGLGSAKEQIDVMAWPEMSCATADHMRAVDGCAEVD